MNKCIRASSLKGHEMDVNKVSGEEESLREPCEQEKLTNESF